MAECAGIRVVCGLLLHPPSVSMKMMGNAIV